MDNQARYYRTGRVICGRAIIPAAVHFSDCVASGRGHASSGVACQFGSQYGASSSMMHAEPLQSLCQRYLPELVANDDDAFIRK
jgi:hypothetical protein